MNCDSPSDLIDPVKDSFPSHYFKREEDPRVFVAKKTKRGPLDEDWLTEYQNYPEKHPIMCAYKLITVEFRYWGIQVVHGISNCFAHLYVDKFFLLQEQARG